VITSRERVALALNHQEPDRIPLDLGASATSGIHVSVVYQLRQALSLDSPGTPVKVIEPYQMLGEVKPDLMDMLGVDVVGLIAPATLFGFRNEGWKPWTTFDGTPVLVPEGFNTDPEPSGDIMLYPVGDKSVPPSGRMPAGGWYFDSIPRQSPIDESRLNVEDNVEEFESISDEDLEYFRTEAERLYTQTDKAILASFGGTSFGDIALVPAPWLKHPKGIRDVAEWYMSLVSRKDYIAEVFDRQCSIALANLRKLYAVVGDRVSAIFVSGADFGMQQGPFLSTRTYRGLFMPVHKRVNDWIHENTQWKSFIHTCGSVQALMPDMIEAGFDIFNPVQCSAANMDPRQLKERFGKQVTFWGGGVDTQHTLPFGTPDEVRAEVLERIRVFGPGAGFVFNPIHNIQALVPIDNLMTMYNTLRENGTYPIR